MVAARDLEPGEVIDAADLRVVEIGASDELRAIQSSQQDLIVGKSARGPIPAGTVLNTDLFADQGDAIPAGMVVVGAALEPGRRRRRVCAQATAVDVLGVAAHDGGSAGDGGTAGGDVARVGDGVVGRGASGRTRRRAAVGLARGAGGVAGGGGAGRGRRAAAVEPGGWPDDRHGRLDPGCAGRDVVGAAARRGVAARVRPSERVVLEADPAGGVVGARYGLGVEPGVVWLVTGVRRNGTASTVRRRGRRRVRSTPGCSWCPVPESGEQARPVWAEQRRRRWPIGWPSTIRRVAGRRRAARDESNPSVAFADHVGAHGAGGRRRVRRIWCSCRRGSPSLRRRCAVASR